MNDGEYRNYIPYFYSTFFFLFPIKKDYDIIQKDYEVRICFLIESPK